MQSQYYCKNQLRRELVRNPKDKYGNSIPPKLNGIDYLEVDLQDQKTLHIYFIHNLPGSRENPVPDRSDFSLTEKNFVIEGGERIRGILIEPIDPAAKNAIAENVLTVKVNKAGDFSAYKLRLVSSSDDSDPPDGFDPQLSEISFSFKAACSRDFDCRKVNTCPAEKISEPEINYLAKDYASFRQLILDRLALLLPEWKERNPADLGVVLVELLAYIGDHLSYQQDAIATEAYLGTARRRISVRRHARLVDYQIKDGCNSRVWVHVEVNQKETTGTEYPVLGAGTKLFTRREGKQALIKPSSSEYFKALNEDGEIFELMHPLTLYFGHNEFRFYTWGETECCLPKGATRATLENNYPNLKVGDVLIFKERLSPSTGKEEDADPGRRHAVRLTRVVSKTSDDFPLTDPLNDQEITEIEWDAEDALPFPLCISTSTEFNEVKDVSIVLGNIALADHGYTIDSPKFLGTVSMPHLFKVVASDSRMAANGSETKVEKITVPPRFWPHLKQKPLTYTAPNPLPVNETSSFGSASSAMRWETDEVLPEIKLFSKLRNETEASEYDTGESVFDNTGTGEPQFDPAGSELWEPQFDLLNSDPHSNPEKKEFVVEVESDGTAYLRFGDGVYGALPEPGTDFFAIYRVGNGVAGNVGAETLAHIVSDITEIDSVSNPLPASGGQEPESIEDVRKNAPYAFRKQERAVTAKDYEEITSRYGGIQRAAATFRWTGSWNTVFVSVDRLGGLEVDSKFKTELSGHLENYRMAGQDMEIYSPQFVHLEIEMQVSVKPVYFRNDVKEALLKLFSNLTLPDGRRGMFHPDNFTFGQSVYLSPIIAAAQSVPGVASVRITTFQRQGNPSSEALKGGELKLGSLEIARLDNDPNFPDRGVFTLNMEGGK
jgi:hypothetical protein